jgi:hypothetical protein
MLHLSRGSGAHVEAESEWLRRSIMRLRAALRFAEEPRVETILREVIASAEDRLIELERSGQPKVPEAAKYQ